MTDFLESAEMPRPAMAGVQPIVPVPGDLSAEAEPGHLYTETHDHRAGHPIRRKAGDVTIVPAETSQVPSRRKNPASAGAVSQGETDTHFNPADGNYSGNRRGADHFSSETQLQSVSAILSRPAGGIVHKPRERQVQYDDADNSGSTGRDPAAPTWQQPNCAAQDHDNFSDGHLPNESHLMVAAADSDDGAHPSLDNQKWHSPVIAELVQAARMRRRWHKAEKSLILQGKALCRAWTAGDKDEATKLYDRAVDGTLEEPMLCMALAPFIDARRRFEQDRATIEKTMRKLARNLPVWKNWAESVKGLGDLRLALLVGECGDIGSYRNPSCLWKRMGLAVIDGGRQRRVSDADDALEHDYNPERRAMAYVFGTELIKAQVRRVKESPEGERPATRSSKPTLEAPDATVQPSIAIGPYGQVYLDRKAYEAGREGITKAHANNRAARYMVKGVLRDLYAAWRRS